MSNKTALKSRSQKFVYSVYRQTISDYRSVEDFDFPLEVLELLALLSRPFLGLDDLGLSFFSSFSDSYFGKSIDALSGSGFGLIISSFSGFGSTILGLGSTILGLGSTGLGFGLAVSLGGRALIVIRGRKGLSLYSGVKWWLICRVKRLEQSLHEMFGSE